METYFNIILIIGVSIMLLFCLFLITILSIETIKDIFKDYIEEDKKTLIIAIFITFFISLSIYFFCFNNLTI